MRRFHMLKRLLRDLGVEEERVRLEWVSASEGKRFAEVVDDMTEKIRELGPCTLRERVRRRPAADDATRAPAAEPLIGTGGR